MPNYYYKAKDKAGKMFQGIIEAVSSEAAAGLLYDKKLTVIDISEEPTGVQLSSFNLPFLKKVKTKELVVFFRQLSVMSNASLPLVKSLRILARQPRGVYLKNIITEVSNEVDGGASLSASMNMFPEVFTDFYVNIIKSGEISGRLSEVMDYLADQKEKDYDLEAKVKGAMIYPGFIISVLVVVGFIIIAFVIPNITAILKESGATLPLITLMLLGFSNFISVFWWLVLLAVAAVIFGWMYFVRTTYGRQVSDYIKINVPIFGKIWRHIYLVRICRSFATLVRGGVPIAPALGIVKDVVDSAIYEQILEKVIKNVDEGSQISEALADNEYIPQIVVQMISIGEESGKLEEVLEKVSDFYSREIDNSVRNLSNLIEPIIMIVLGVAVGLFVTAVILPMWQLSSSF